VGLARCILAALSAEDDRFLWSEFVVLGYHWLFKPSRSFLSGRDVSFCPYKHLYPETETRKETETETGKETETETRKETETGRDACIVFLLKI